MSLAVLNINDAGIQVAVDGDLIRTSPGFAVLDNGRLMIGESAARNTKLLPRWTNNRFWSQLSTAPISGGTSQVRHHADLAFAHLEELWKPIADSAQGVIFVVPGYYSAENLGLMLGMAKECRIPVAGIVDTSVLVASNLPLRSIVLHLDIHLHSITLTRLSNTGSIIRRDVRTVLETGLATLWDRWATIIANQFIQSTRFDPTHDASSEQQLYNQLPSWISNLGSESMHTFDLATGETEHTVAVSNESLLRACTPLYPQIVQAIRSEIPAGESASLLVSHHFSGFPGLEDSLRLISETDTVDLTELKSIGSAHLHQDKIRTDSGAISHITQLDTGQVSDEETPRARVPTHLLWNHHASAIGSSYKLGGNLSNGPSRSEAPLCTFHLRNGDMIMDCHGDGVLINGNAAAQTNTLQTGDRIEVNGATLVAISVSANG